MPLSGTMLFGYQSLIEVIHHITFSQFYSKSETEKYHEPAHPMYFVVYS